MERGESNLLFCLHIMISVRQLAPRDSQKKKKKNYQQSRVDIVLCLYDFDILTRISAC